MNEHGYRGATAVLKEILEHFHAWAMSSVAVCRCISPVPA